ncbi:MAG: glycosyltransferase [Paramuribaculum sp.]|nr:glycosyltransferase [Paramuribaculum sp.]
MISVIVTTYNQENTIGRTLQSILSQNIDVPYEIVIGDDCSSDCTREVCEKYEKKYPEIIRYFRREHNLGVVTNYFQCVRDCRGKYIADCAGDDFWVDNDKLAKEFELMESDRDISLVHTDWRCCDADGTNPRIISRFKNENRNTKKVFAKGKLTGNVLLHDNIGKIHLCSAMYRRDLLLSELNEKPSLFISDDYNCEDLQIVTALSALGKVVYIPDITLYYTVTPDSISHNSDFDKKYRQIKSNLILTERLRQEYCDKDTDITEYNMQNMEYLAAQVFHSGDVALRKDYYELKKSSTCFNRINFKNHVWEMSFANRCLWKFFRYLLGKDISR